MGMPHEHSLDEAYPPGPASLRAHLDARQRDKTLQAQVDELRARTDRLAETMAMLASIVAQMGLPRENERFAGPDDEEAAYHRQHGA